MIANDINPQQGCVILTATWENFSDSWVEEYGKEVDGDDGHDEDEELGEGTAGDKNQKLFVKEEIFDALQGHVRKTGDLTKKVGGKQPERKTRPSKLCESQIFRL